MFESRHRSSGGSANRWLVVAGAGLVILAFVARMLLDIGQTRVSDLAAAMRPDTATATPPATTIPEPDATPGPPLRDTAAAVAGPPAPSGTVVATPPVLKTESTTKAPPPSAKPIPAPPPKPATVPPAAPPAPTGTGYAVQLGAFGSEANAAKLSGQASALGYSAAVIPQARGGATLYLVRVTGLAGANQARQAADSLARALAVKSVVVPPGR